MVTNPEAEEPQPSEAESIVRNIIAGHPQGAVRRQVLYGIAVLGTSILGTIATAAAGIPAGLVGLVALTAVFLLATTDSLA